jgi:triosephosphate isomerase (TIM)
MKKKYIIAGNWKMNPQTVEEAKRIATQVKKVALKTKKIETVACPPFVYSNLIKIDDGFSLGAQDVYFEQAGSFTGEVSAEMLKSIGAKYVIVGHAERRKMGDTDEIVAQKLNAAVGAGVQPILCVGEKERDQNGDYLGVLKNQIITSLGKLARKDVKQLVVAYEPLWAIGATSAMTPADVRETALFIKKVLSDTYGQEYALQVKILYGGSVTFKNAKDIVALGQVDGLLVGRESVNPEGFNLILKEIDAI